MYEKQKSARLININICNRQPVMSQCQSIFLINALLSVTWDGRRSPNSQEYLMLDSRPEGEGKELSCFGIKKKGKSLHETVTKKQVPDTLISYFQDL